jgi:sigma-E factor negative regulatory protein RseB
MRWRSFASLNLLCALVLALGCGLNAANAQSSSTAPGMAAANQGAELDPKSARHWLSRIHDAAGRYDFQGTLVVSAGTGVHSARIVHVGREGERFERIEALDGQERLVFRQDRVVQTFWPGSGVVQIEQREVLPDFPALLQGGPERIADFYQLRRLGSDRVAGLEADVLLLLPRDDARFAHRLWADRKTGLLLRAEILGPHDEVLESSAFTELVLGSRISKEGLIKSMPKLDGLRVIRNLAKPIRIADEGWVLQGLVPGFQQVSSVKRPIHGHEPKGVQGKGMLHLVFSDGMTYVSMFVEPFESSADQLALQTSIGATRTLMQRKGDWWITVMGDVPFGTLQRFYAGLERRR